jgi:hypothetical protein
MAAVFCCDKGGGGGSVVMKVVAAMRHGDGRWVKTAVNGGNGAW